MGELKYYANADPLEDQIHKLGQIYTDQLIRIYTADGEFICECINGGVCLGSDLKKLRAMLQARISSGLPPQI